MISIEINPIDKVQDFIDKLAGYTMQINHKSDEGYEWLEEEDVYIVIPHPQTENSLEILFENEGELILFFANNHAHYRTYEEDYQSMYKDALDILNSRLGSATLFFYTAEENNWLGSRFVTPEEANQSFDTVFDFTLQWNANKLKTNGGYAQFVFWDTSLNKTVKIKKKT